MTNEAQEQVVLVDEQDRDVGLMEKIQAHEEGKLHRAFSVFVFRTKNGEPELLLQERAVSKYHFGGLWTNTTCGHPRKGETPVQAGERRLSEEMGFTLPLQAVGSFMYFAKWDNGLAEHELDHVVVARVPDVDVKPNPDEADGYRWITIDALDQELEQQAERFTPWFFKAYPLARAWAKGEG